jgi:uncharacterized RDD family membrane protein YckC
VKKPFMENPELSIFPEQEVVYAGFWRRFVAVILDGLILMVPGELISMAIKIPWLSQLDAGTSPVLAAVLAFVSSFISLGIDWLYFAFMESGHRQASVGKMALGLKVTNEAGGRITFGQATGRYFGRILSGIILFIGYFMNLWDPRRQTLHDKMSHTLVIKEQQ